MPNRLSRAKSQVTPKFKGEVFMRLQDGLPVTSSSAPLRKSLVPPSISKSATPCVRKGADPIQRTVLARRTPGGSHQYPIEVDSSDGEAERAQPKPRSSKTGQHGSQLDEEFLARNSAETLQRVKRESMGHTVARFPDKMHKILTLDIVRTPLSAAARPSFPGQSTSSSTASSSRPVVPHPHASAKRVQQSESSQLSTAFVKPSAGSREVPVDLVSVSTASTSSSIRSIPPPHNKYTSASPVKARSSAFGSHAKKPNVQDPPHTPSRTPRPIAAEPTMTSSVEVDRVLGRSSSRHSGFISVSKTGQSAQPLPHPSHQQRSVPLSQNQPSGLHTSRPSNGLRVHSSEQENQVRGRKRKRHDGTYETDVEYRPKSRTSDIVNSSRPIRDRPKPGAYTLPTVDTPVHLWPMHKASRFNTGGKRLKSGQSHSTRLSDVQSTIRPDTPKSTSLNPFPAASNTCSKPTKTRSTSSPLTPLPSQSSAPPRTQLGPLFETPGTAVLAEEPEVVETVEERKEDGEDGDILALFADYEFSTPTPTTLSQQGPPPRTPRSTGKVSSLLTPSRKHPDILSPGHRAISPLRARRQASPARRPGSPELSPRQELVSPAKRAVPVRKSDGTINAILADADTKLTTARDIDQRQLDERRRRIEALEGTDEVDEQLENPLDLLDAVAKPPLKSPSEPIRRSIRVRSTSTSNRDGLRQPTKAKPGPSAFDRLVNQERRERRKGTDGDTADRLLESLRRPSPVKGKTEVPYPTPNSGQEPSAEPEDEKELAVDMIKLDAAMLDSSAIGVMLEDVRRSKREVERSTSKRSIGMTDWRGFWDGPEPLSLGKVEPPTVLLSGNSPMVALARGLCEGGDIPALTALLVSGALVTLFEEPTDVTSLATYLLTSALIASTPQSGALAMEGLLYLLRTVETHPFMDSSTLLTTVVSIWMSLGARASSIPPQMLAPASVFCVDRHTASGLICALAQCSTQCGWFLSHEARELAQILLFLAVDTSTPSALRRTIDDTLVALWPVCLSDSNAVEIAKHVCASTKLESLAMRVDTLLAIGQSSEESREISRWVAIGLLVPGCLHDPGETCLDVVPSIGMLVKGTQGIYDILVSKIVDHEVISDLLTLLAEAMSDIDALVHISSDTTQFEDLRDDLRASANRIHIRLSDSLEGQNKARLTQLDTVLNMQLGAATRRRQKKQRKELIHLETREGNGGQTRLSFGMNTIE